MYKKDLTLFFPMPLLWMLLGAAFFMRLVFPFYWNPLDHLGSDPLRHWENAQLYKELHFFGGMDPKTYQLFLAPIYAFWKGAREPSTWAIGALCSGTGIFWYLTARELLSQRAAVITGIVLCLVPSLLVVFGYFMTETMIIFCMGLAWWLSLLAWRKRSTALFVMAVAAWWLAILARVIALPLGLGVIGFLWWVLPRKTVSLIAAIIVSVILLYPAAKFTEERIHIFTPFSYGMLNKIYLRSHHRWVQFSTSQGQTYFFVSPSFYMRPLEPFSDYQITKLQDPYIFHIDLANGAEDWEREYAKVSADYYLRHYLGDVKDNILYTLFAPSWPDYSANGQDHWLLVAGYQHRWIWAPLILVVFWATLSLRLPPRQALFIAATAGFVLVMFFHNAVTMEGRYRKPVEPMLLISAAIIAMAFRRGAEATSRTLWGHGKWFFKINGSDPHHPANGQTRSWAGTGG